MFALCRIDGIEIKNHCNMLGLFEEKMLFDEGKKHLTRFDMGNGALVLREQFFDKEMSDRMYAVLMEQTPWQQRERKMYDKMVLDPRLTAWYGPGGHVWTPELLLIREKVQAASSISFDSVLLNLYRDGKDSVSWHSDTRPASGQHQPIASVTFGQTRMFHVRHKFDKAIKPFSIPLMHGSFLLMPACMQEYWEHHVPKTSKQVAARINLTFRITT